MQPINEANRFDVSPVAGIMGPLYIGGRKLLQRVDSTSGVAFSSAEGLPLSFSFTGGIFQDFLSGIHIFHKMWSLITIIISFDQKRRQGPTGSKAPTGG